MLAIRLQRTGRSGHAQFRVIVQDDRFSPKSGRIVAYVGSYNPHTKEAKLDGEKVSQYLDNGAQPSDRVAELLKKEGIKLPVWVKTAEPQKRATRNPEKLRRNRPAGAPAPEPAAEQGETAEAETEAAEVPAETPAEEPAEVLAPAGNSSEDTIAEKPAEQPAEQTGEPEPAAEEPAAETPAEEPKAEDTPEPAA